MKRFIIPVLLLGSAGVSAAQNLQLHYDFGKALYRSEDRSLEYRPQLTTTVEMFRPDRWGSTFFFVDMNYGSRPGDRGVLGAYWEIYRNLRFWDIPVSVHLEYNGGLDIQGPGNGTGAYDDAWLAGADWSVASSDYSRTLSLAVMYKAIPGNLKNPHNFQITAAWNVWFWQKRFLFCGFADFWMENRPWQITGRSGNDGTDFIFLAEPQLWYNFNTIKGLEQFNLSAGSEVEISSNFVSAGFFVIPTLAVKWTF